jgi:DNA helicase HerA-like ATPase
MLMPERDRQRHTYVLGKSGSGKSELLKLLVYGYLRKPGSATVVVIDPHGDLAEEVARFKEHRKSDRLIYIDPYLDGSGGRMPTINPFELRDTGPQAIDIAAQSMLEAFKQILRNTALTLQMEALLIPSISVLLKRRGSTLLDLQRFMNDQRNGDLVRLGERSDNPAQRLFFRDRFYAKTFDATKASIATKIQSLLNSRTFFQLTVGESTLDIEQALDSRKLVIFNLAKGKLGSETSEAFGRFLLALMQSAILKRAQSATAARVPVHLFIDEFQNYIAPSIAEILSESRKFGLHLTMAQQYLGQRMDAEFRRGILANTQIKMTGMSGNDSRAAIAKETGLAEATLAQLGVGQFYVKVGNRPAFRLDVPPFLIGNRHALSWEDWHGVKEHQLDAYYRVIPTTTADSADVRGSDPDEYRGSDDVSADDDAPPPKPKFTF